VETQQIQKELATRHSILKKKISEVISDLELFTQQKVYDSNVVMVSRDKSELFLELVAKHGLIVLSTLPCDPHDSPGYLFFTLGLP